MSFSEPLALRFIPYGIHLLQAHVRQVTTLLDGMLLQIIETADELLVRALQCIVGVNLVQTGSIDEAEHHIAELRFRLVLVHMLHFRLELTNFFLHLAPHLRAFFPIEARIQDKARNVGFDWEERSQVWSKVKEEISEFEAEVEHMDKDKAEAEFGDVMFSLINAARLYKINPDNALERTNQKFIRRFNYLEEHTIKQGRNLTDMTLEEMDAVWNEAKSKGL